MVLVEETTMQTLTRCFSFQIHHLPMTFIISPSHFLVDFWSTELHNFHDPINIQLGCNQPFPIIYLQSFTL